jgi:hypothetical protein
MSEREAQPGASFAAAISGKEAEPWRVGIVGWFNLQALQFDDINAGGVRLFESDPHEPSGDSLFLAGAHTIRCRVRERAMNGLEAFRVNRLRREADSDLSGKWVRLSESDPLRSAGSGKAKRPLRLFHPCGYE